MGEKMQKYNTCYKVSLISHKN